MIGNSLVKFEGKMEGGGIFDFVTYKKRKNKLLFVHRSDSCRISASVVDIIVREGKRDNPVFSAILSTKLVMVERVNMDVVKYSCIQK